MTDSRKFFKDKKFDIQAERVELYNELKKVEQAAVELDPAEATNALIKSKMTRVRLLNDMQESIYTEDKILIAAESTRKQADHNLKLYVPKFKEVKGKDGKIILIKEETNIEDMKLIE